METIDGNRIETLGSYCINSLIVSGKELGARKVQVLRTLPLGVDVIVGLDVMLVHGLDVSTSKRNICVEFGQNLDCVEERKRNKAMLLLGNESVEKREKIKVGTVGRGF